MTLMTSSLLLQQCLECLIRFTSMVWKMGGRWPYSCCFVENCFQDSKQHTEFLRSSYLAFSPSFFCMQVVHPYCSTDANTATIWMKSRCVLSERSYNLLKAIHIFARCMLTSLSVDELLLPRYVNWSNFRGFQLNVKMVPSSLKYINSVLFVFTLRPLDGSSAFFLSRHFYWSLLRRYISIIFVYDMPRSRTSNVKRKWIHNKKKRKGARRRRHSADLWQMQTTQLI